MLLRRTLSKVALACQIPTMIALNIPINPNNILLQTPSPPTTNITFTPWPETPFKILVHSTSIQLTFLRVTKFTSKHSVSIGLSRLLAFISTFGISLQDMHLDPDYVPRQAGDSAIDIQSYTKWQIRITELPLGNRLPTPWAVAALEELQGLIRLHGVAGDITVVIQEGKTRYSWIDLTVSTFGVEGRNVLLEFDLIDYSM